MACFVPEYVDEEPQLGRVTNINDGNSIVEVEWMVRSYAKPWKVWREKRGRDYVTWKESISTNAVIFPLTLTKTERISNGLISKLKTTYEEKCKHHCV